MKRVLIFILFFGLAACSSTKDDPLIIPPNFAEMPDEKNPQLAPEKSDEEKVARLKELLLKSEE
jgi:hypothetical protein